MMSLLFREFAQAKPPAWNRSRFIEGWDTKESECTI
jgi:hypothetical protein